MPPQFSAHLGTTIAAFSPTRLFAAHLKFSHLFTEIKYIVHRNLVSYNASKIFALVEI
jgi:hypothetical protein